MWVKEKGKLIVAVLAVSWSMFQILSSTIWTIHIFYIESAHVAFATSLIFLLYPHERRKWFDFSLAILAIVSGIYTLLNIEKFLGRMSFVEPVARWDLFFGIATLLLVLEATRRTVGLSLPIVSVAFLLYAYLGNHLPGILRHKGFKIEDIVEYLYLLPNGIYGTPTEVSATFLFLFILFSSFLEKSGAGYFFVDLAFAVTGRVRGGPAKAAVVSSSLFGTISGSAVANVVGTGTFTIPLMKRTGYPPHFAGAVEAVASTGGQIMPPVMGAAAFLMAEILGISYFKVCLHAMIPAILYYISVFFQVDLRAAKMGLKGLPSSELPKIWSLMKSQGYFLISLAILVLYLVSGYTPSFAAIVGLGSIYALSFIRKSTRLGWKRLVGALESGAKNVLPVASACACCGIVIGIILLTGIGLRLSEILITVSGGNKTVILVLIMLLSLLLGMGMPTIGAYITVVTLLVPAVINLGYPPIAAHMFAFYFSVISFITPPVALASYAAAGIAGSRLWETGLAAFKLGLAGLIVPYMFIVGTPLLFIGSFSEIGLAFLSSSLGVWCLAQAIEGYSFQPINFIERGILLTASLFLIHVGYLTDFIGYGLLLIVLVYQSRVKIYNTIKKSFVKL
jgi:TRAP transporter 4TM/12TM fusion protein